MASYPLCNYEDLSEKFIQLRESWKFRFYTVRMFECPECEGVFNYNEGISLQGKHSVFTTRIRHKRFT